MRNKKGFTLAELLIVVAIIAVLVAIAIPIFINQLEKSREATDAANIRAAYAEVMVHGLEDPDNDFSKTVASKQTMSDWQNSSIEDIGGLAVGNSTSQIKAQTSGAEWTITYSKDTQKVTITPIN